MTIEPDTKDWTWVLERPCPECGYDACQVRASDVAGRVRADGEAWPRILARPDAAIRTDAARWSVLEYGCHVRDVNVLYLERLGRMLTEEDPLFANWDQDATAQEQRYAEQRPDVVARELVTASRALAARLDGVTGAAWARPGRRSDGATFTIDSFARYLLHDLVHHRFDVGDA